MPDRPDAAPPAAPLNLTAPALGDAPIGQPVSVDLGLWAPGTSLTAELLRDGAVIQTGLDGGDIAFTPADDEAELALRVTGVSADASRSETIVSAPVIARYAPPALVPGGAPDGPEIYDEDTGPQALDLGPAFTGDNLSFTVAGLAAATIDPATGVLTTSTAVPIASGEAIVTATNSGGSEAITVEIIVEDGGDTILTQTSLQTSVADPKTGHVFSFVAADGVTPEAREVGQYQDGTWFVLGGVGDEVRIGSITPVSVGVSTAAYTRPDNLNDEANTGTRIRFMHGTMVNPWQGVAPAAGSKMGFDSYYGFASSASNVAYQHSLNVDPGATGAPLVVAEGSVVKSESVIAEGGHTSSDQDKTRMRRMSCLTVVPEIPAANSFRPPIRGTDKRSYWTTDQLDIPASRRAIAGGLISGLNAWSVNDINSGFDRISHIQQTFAPFQEPARRWNPGAHGGGVLIYGNDWYYEFSKFFATFYSAEFTDAQIEPITKAVIQVGIDIYGLMTDNSYYFWWQAHHAGRKGIAFAAGLLLNDQNILDQCDANLHPEHFGVDDAYTGYVTEEMVGIQPRYAKGYYQLPWTEDQVGLAEWAAVFVDGDPPANVATQDQIVDAGFFNRSYQVLSCENGAMFQALWGMLSDPTAQYYKPAYFDFMDRYLAVRFGDQIDGVWDASGDAASTNGVFGFNGGNWWSINPSNADVLNMKRMRDACPRRNYVLDMPPEALPAPTVTHDGTSGHLDVDFNANNIRIPQNKDVPITGYDLRWIAYAGGADTTATSEFSANYIGKYEWRYINDITLPYQLTGLPRGHRVLIQLRMKNANGAGPWLDERRRSSYPFNTQTFTPLGPLPVHARRIAIPDDAAFDTVPLNFGPPVVTPTAGVTTGGVLTATDGIWTDNPAITATERKWQVSDDGETGWSDIPGATTATFAATAAEEGKFVRSGVRKTNSEGASEWAYNLRAAPVSAPMITALTAANHGVADYNPGAGALGGRRLLILQTCRANAPVAVGGSIGAHAFGAAEAIYADNNGTSGPQRERQIAYIVEIPAGETAETVAFNATGVITGTETAAAYELANPLQFAAADGIAADGAVQATSVAGGAAFWMARSAGWVNFGSSATLVQHDDNPAQNTNTKWSFAHAFVVPNGTVSVAYTNQFASNTRATLLSLAPVA